MSAFSRQVGIDVVGGLGFSGVFYGLMLGALIPLLASVGPISLALRTKLINALDARRPKVQGVKFSIQYGDQAGKLVVVLFKAMRNSLLLITPSPLESRERKISWNEIALSTAISKNLLRSFTANTSISCFP